ncbi:MAG: membrane protein insertion efficiency factor YidD [Gemmatimonadetes bacterium]|nr:membrane protein insertion efficiency factor YidD [Gemmatimonadota bacterium]NIR79147.1 membrane protein insertion efficiency factor YidD [Gemmatimonadota bacterium]NIT87800.1 membrane protein insertion efficiency factor YidD [Gemmatimonadota bacterium]NIU31663.1 membrane protein insertion efficiency factor YidD [Gemmatimonadota bacterium]NIU36285.1 membrane protein insertion efficiency factor YidD [Gemmatimonadota bacterium]
MLARILLGLIRFYRRAVSPWTLPACRFTPTCSAYAQEAVERHGPWRGSGLALRRLLRCHPFGGSGWDPVPESESAEGVADDGAAATTTGVTASHAGGARAGDR